MASENKKATKRSIDELEKEEDYKQQLTTRKEDKSEDGHYATPAKRHLQFDFWTPEDQKKEEILPTNIRELTAGTNIKEQLTFRVCFKSETKQTTSGPSMTFHGMDNTGEITLVTFRKQAAKYGDLLKLNGIYTIQNYSAKKEGEFDRSNTGHDLQIFLTAFTTCVKVEEEVDIPPVPFNFITIEDISKMPVHTKIDTIGVIVKDWGIETTARGTIKRDVCITDESKKTIAITLWGSHAQRIVIPKNGIVATRNGSVSNYLETTSINCLKEALFWVDPDIKRRDDLEEWFKQEMKK